VKSGIVDNESTINVPLTEADPWGKVGPDCVPNSDDVRKGTLAALQEISPFSLKPPYMWICDKHDILMTHTAPYTAPLCCIESKWNDGKGWVANAVNQKAGRGCSEVVKLLRQKWYYPVPDPNKPSGFRDPIPTHVWVDHCHREMNLKIDECMKNKGPLGGTIFDLKFDNEYFQDCTNDEEITALFRKNAGMGESFLVGIGGEDDTELDGDINGLQKDDDIYEDDGDEDYSNYRLPVEDYDSDDA
jgi:hypothetical protein